MKESLAVDAECLYLRGKITIIGLKFLIRAILFLLVVDAECSGIDFFVERELN